VSGADPARGGGGESFQLRVLILRGDLEIKNR
jgi:hypothetical protein